MGAAVKIRERPSAAQPRGAMIDEVVRSLPWYFEMDLSTVLRFDISAPSVRLAHRLMMPVLCRLEGVSSNKVFIVFGYAIERLIGLTIAGMDPVAAGILRKRLNGYLELEKATRCMHVSGALDRLQTISEQTDDAGSFPVGRVIFESADGDRRFVVEGMAMQHLAQCLQRSQGIPAHSAAVGSNAHSEDRDPTLEYLRGLSFATTLHEHDLPSDHMDAAQALTARTRVIRHLYRFLMHHTRPQTFMQDRWMRRLIIDISSLTSWPVSDIMELSTAACAGRLSVVQKKNDCCDI